MIETKMTKSAGEGGFSTVHPNPSSSSHYNYVFKYIIIGEMGVGKSCLLTRFVEEKCKLRGIRGRRGDQYLSIKCIPYSLEGNEVHYSWTLSIYLKQLSW